MISEQIDNIDRDFAREIAREMFNMYDADKTGSLERSETIIMMQEAYKIINKSFNPSKGDIDSYIEVLDAGKDGAISLEDFEAHAIRILCGGDIVTLDVMRKAVLNPVQSALKEKWQKLIRKQFQQYDKDNNHFIDEHELRPLLRDTFSSLGHVVEPSQEEVRNYLNRVDTSGDG